jgi:hypothetical protein
MFPNVEISFTDQMCDILALVTLIIISLGFGSRSANGVGCNGFYGTNCFIGCVWMCGNEFLYLMSWV